ncbi:hypothetical protein P1X14_12320 [Sphingomonas sp. AOB5]|uniref:hypothetical protein n=1 Tax=Sphingomonas sp. AOB5 TaxID=3034017 RepID=UPI0023F6DDAA|nr:hypothetical protein [Sphingomonas sp. AOB5]MDF7776035.1 hypothetical protein [Sphingomonas sp. AOB5]
MTSITETFLRGFGVALADARQRVLEEGWFGKIVSPRAQTITLGSQAGEKTPGEHLGWAHPTEPERGIDR